jgi:Flp pilus assembly protein TadB
MAIFLIGAVILSIAVIGGAYALQQRGAQVRTNEPIAQQRDTNESQNNQSQQQSEEDKQKAEAEKKAAEAKKAEEQKAAADKKAEQERAAAEAQKQQAAAEAEKKRQQAAAQQPASIPQTSTAPTANTLPQTGPSESLPEFIGAALLLGAVIAYLKSYRHRFGSLLK